MTIGFTMHISFARLDIVKLLISPVEKLLKCVPVKLALLAQVTPENAVTRLEFKLTIATAAWVLFGGS